MIRIYCLKKIKIEKKKSLFKKEYIQVGESQEVQSPSTTQTSHQPASWEYAGSPACCSPLEGPLASVHCHLRYPLWLELFCHHCSTLSFYSLFCLDWKLVQNHTLL